VIALTSPYLWYCARATGEVALVLLTATVVLGSLVATRVGGEAVGRFELNELHRSVSMLAVVFVAIHVTVTVADSYVPIGVFSALVPFTSSYRRLPVAIGTIAIDLMLAAWISSLAKERIRHSSWRFIHWFGWLCLGAAITHGFVTGSDAHQPWSLALTASFASAAVAAAVWRVTRRPARAAGRTAHSPLRNLERHVRAGSPRPTPRPRAATPRDTPRRTPPAAARARRPSPPPASTRRPSR
jgi:DMSO/TMAO reductase YedYZ heme-binding membrane subunit